MIARAPAPGDAGVVLAREPGFAIKLVTPLATGGPVVPPGQGQLLVPLRGTVSVEEHSGGDTKVTQTARQDRSGRLQVGQLWKIPNDAAWRIRSADRAVVLQISTSVPRQEDRLADLLARARTRLHMGPARIFGNEVLRVEFSVGRTRLPGLGQVPWDHRAEGVEYAVGLAGRWRARLRDGEDTWTGTLETGQMLRIAPGVAHNFAARTSLRPSVGLILTSLRRTPPGPVARESVQGFSPFVDRG